MLSNCVHTLSIVSDKKMLVVFASAIKPDGVQRGLIAEIIKRFEQKGFILVAIKIVQPTEDMARGHYDDLKALV